MSLFDKLSKNTSEPASFEDPQKRRLAHLRARLPNFSMFMDSRKVSEEYAIFLMQKLDDCREEIRKGIHELELKVEANKLGLNEPLPSVDSFIAEIERIIQEKTSEAEKKAYFTKWLSKFGPDKADRLYDLGVHVFETAEKKARGFARAQTIKAVSIVGALGLLIAGGTLLGAHYLTRYNSTTQIQNEQRLELDEHKETLKSYEKRLDLYKDQIKSQEKVINNFGKSLTNHAEFVAQIMEEQKRGFNIQIGKAEDSAKKYSDSNLVVAVSGVNQRVDGLSEVVDSFPGYSSRLTETERFIAETITPAISPTGSLARGISETGDRINEFGRKQDKLQEAVDLINSGGYGQSIAKLERQVLKDKTELENRSRLEKLDREFKNLTQPRINPPINWTNDFRIRYR